MVSVGLGDFLALLVYLTDAGAEGAASYGRCPDCLRPVDAGTLNELIGELLAHELQYHADHAEH